MKISFIRFRLRLLGVAAVLLLAGCTKEPEACFTANRLAVIPGKSITFINCSTNATVYNWDFGDDGTSTDAAPLHVFTTKGSYTVTLEAQNDKGDAATLSQEVFVGDPGPLAVVVDTMRFPATQASEIEVFMDGLPTNSSRITNVDLPYFLNTDPATLMTGNSYTLRIKTSLDDGTVTFNPQTDIRGDMTLRVSNPPFWSAYIVFTGR
ncbi:MAG: PKD domain-containing protein [Bacteroidota bacterium]